MPGNDEDAPGILLLRSISIFPSPASVRHRGSFVGRGLSLLFSPHLPASCLYESRLARISGPRTRGKLFVLSRQICSRSVRADAIFRSRLLFFLLFLPRVVLADYPLSPSPRQGKHKSRGCSAGTSPSVTPPALQPLLPSTRVSIEHVNSGMSA